MDVTLQPGISRMDLIEKRVRDLEKEQILIRGPVRLEHNRPLTSDDGHLGEVVVTVRGTKTFLFKLAASLATAVLLGAGGTILAIRTHFVDQGRAIEKKLQNEERLLRVERAQKRCQCSRVSGDDGPDVVTPDP